jgi:hypothetical protein
MPEGKQAGIRCVQLTSDNECSIYGKPERPPVCCSYQATDLCGSGRDEALRSLAELEELTKG